MKVIKRRDDSYSINATIDEMRMLNNALNEVCHGIDLEEFQTRLGYSRKKVEEVLEQINRLVT